MSYWAIRGTSRAKYATSGKRDFACILSTLQCETLRYSRPNTHYTAQIPYGQCESKFSSATTTRGPTTSPRPVRAIGHVDEPSWSGGPAEWGTVQWVVVSLPLTVLCFALCMMWRFLYKRRDRQLQRVYVAPAAINGVHKKVQWDLVQAGRLTTQELQKLLKAIKDAEQADGTVRPRHLAFGARNYLGVEHLRTLRVLLDNHPQVSISLDTDWRSADDQCLKVLSVLLGRRDRCVLQSSERCNGLNTLELPPDSNVATIEALAEALTASGHTEVDAISFAPASSSKHSGKNSAVVALTPLRLSCQELVLRRSAMADLGTAALCAFVRPWAARIQVMRLTECEIGDEGAVALSRLLGPALRELCLTSNCIADHGISEIAKALSMCDSLERLLLDRNSIGDAGSKALGAHLLRSNVQELTLGSHLGGNPVGEEGVEALARALDDELPRAAANRASRLGALNLDGCLIGDRGAEALATYLPKSAVMALSVARGRVGDGGAEAIVRALPRTCQSLDLSGNGLSDRSATAVAEAFYRIPQLAVSLANNHLSIGLRTILHEEHGTRLRL